MPASLRPFITAPEPDDEPQGPPGIRFEPGRVYELNDTGAIISRHGRREAARLAGEAAVQAQAEEEAIAASTLDAETAAILQEKHDVDVALQIRAAEIRRRDADAAVTAAQNEGAGAEQKPPAIYVKRAAG